MFKPEAFDFRGKSVIVTGAGKGLGRGLAKSLHQSGATVYAISRTKETLDSLLEECPGIKVFTCDISDWDSARQVVEDFPAIDFLVNNAAIVRFGHTMSHTFSDLDELFKTNLAAVVNLSQVFAKKLIDAGKPGCILNISSTSGIRPVSQCSGYSFFKAALDHLTRNMAQELGPKNIRVNGINPGGIRTDSMDAEAFGRLPSEVQEQFLNWDKKIPFPQKMIEVSEIANLTLFMLSDAAPMMHGSNVVIDGGYCVHS